MEKFINVAACMTQDGNYNVILTIHQPYSFMDFHLKMSPAELQHCIDGWKHVIEALDGQLVKTEATQSEE